MQGRIKVIHIINNLEVGGAERALITQLKAFKKYPDIEMSVISLEGHGPLTKELLDLGIKLKEFNYKLFTPNSRLFRNYSEPDFIEYLKQEKPDIIHGHLLVAEDYAKYAGGRLGIPVITTIHDVINRPKRRQLALNQYLSSAVAVSPTVRDYIEEVYKVPENKIVIIPNAIEFGEFESGKKKFNPEKPVFIYVGRISESKGLVYAIEGLAQLLPEYPNLEFLVYGKPVNSTDINSLERVIKKHNWKFVKLMGLAENVSTALSTGDIFVLPSKTEGFAIAALEAAAASKPLIVTKTGAMKEMVEDRVSGYFVEYGSPVDIARAAGSILKQGPEKMGQKSHEINKDRFSVEKSAEMYYNLYLRTNKNNA